MEPSNSEALLIFAHGSRVAEANEAVEEVADSAAQAGGFRRWKAAFLELAEPSLVDAVRQLHAEGVERIFITPYFLVMGIHLKKDLPALIAEAEEQSPGVELVCTAPLGGHPDLAKILAQRAAEARGAFEDIARPSFTR